jgi:hypothetical protein
MASSDIDRPSWDFIGHVYRSRNRGSQYIRSLTKGRSAYRPQSGKLTLTLRTALINKICESHSLAVGHTNRDVLPESLQNKAPIPQEALDIPLSGTQSKQLQKMLPSALTHGYLYRDIQIQTCLCCHKPKLRSTADQPLMSRLSEYPKRQDHANHFWDTCNLCLLAQLCHSISHDWLDLKSENWLKIKYDRQNDSNITNPENLGPIWCQLGFDDQLSEKRLRYA